MPNNHFSPGEEVFVAIPQTVKRRAKVISQHGTHRDLYYIRMWFDEQKRWAKGMRTINQQFLEKASPTP